MTVGASAPAAPGSNWSVVAAQLRKNRLAVFAGACVQGLVVVAAAAPLLAFNVPLVEVGVSGPSFPLFDQLFDRFLFPGGVDVFFNLLLVAVPVWWLASRLGRRRAAARYGDPPPRRAPVRTAVVALWTLLLVVAAAFGASYLARVLAVVVAPPAAFLLVAPSIRWPGWRRRSWIAPSVVSAAFAIGFVAIVALPAFESTRPLVDHRARVEAGEAAGTIRWAVFPPVPFHPASVGETDPARTVARSLKPPDSVNLMGCDLNGRDVLSRLVFGTRISMTIGIVAVAIYILIGTILGSLAGYYGGKVDLLVMRLVEVMICFPTLFLLLTIVAVFESRSIFLIMGAIGLVGWPGVTRLVRAEFLRQRSLDYVVAARAQGMPERRVIFAHVLPNCMGPVLVSATLGVASAILVESSLAFLGLGDPSAASWGEMLTRGRETLKWHLILIPGGAIFFVVTVFNLFGEGLRDALDPKLRR